MLENQLPKLDLNITNRCNFRCVHCAFDSGCKEMKELSLKKIKQILVQTKKLGGERFDITGGEPLLRNDVFQIVEFGKKLGYKIELVTNGSLLSNDKLGKFKNLGLDAIAVSLDGSNYKIYDKIRNVSKRTYEKVVNNIKKAVAMGFNVKINTLVCKSNYKDIPNIIQFCIENNIKEQGMYYFTPVGRGERNNERAVEPLAWLKFIQEHLLRYEDKIKIGLEVPLAKKGLIKKENRCIADSERYHLQILPDGNVYPCAILASYEKPIANLHKTNIPDIWQNKKLWREYWDKINILFTACKYCVNFKAFNISCYDFEKYDFVCPLRKFKPSEVV
ncbi:MAG: radical SAM protein [Nanoarchaeota archaeon]|nr:radical SAM protein [Nanoarchaeota archaeon]MBU1320830.1 radical SAM protein [Nanoarchaeota archaeon]MBU1596840.1 radical SAM protein [Nanoarchaeota archaeon]MBU2440908.1 radical SAM protein [Nanoarchaeota archaeon]